ncbi:MAG: hypothetical protein IPG17_02340 [Sandaracinaceae bacterium]|nr:hypothetical protein [Sandaracinaceae bacterium]
MGHDHTAELGLCGDLPLDGQRLANRARRDERIGEGPVFPSVDLEALHVGRSQGGQRGAVATQLDGHVRLPEVRAQELACVGGRWQLQVQEQLSRALEERLREERPFTERNTERAVRADVG